MKVVWGSGVYAFAVKIDRTGLGLAYPTQYGYDHRYWDSVLRRLSGSLIETEFKQTKRGGGEKTVRIEKPSPIPYFWGRDISLFGSHFGAFNELITMSSYGKRKRLQNEHQVSHTSVKGTVAYGQITRFRRTWRPITKNFFGQNFTFYDIESPSRSGADGYPNINSSRIITGGSAPDLRYLGDVLNSYTAVGELPNSYDYTGNVYRSRLARSKLLDISMSGDIETGFVLEYTHAVRVWGSSSMNAYWDQCKIHTVLTIRPDESLLLTPNSLISPSSPYYRYGWLRVEDSISDHTGSPNGPRPGELGDTSQVFSNEVPLYGCLSAYLTGDPPPQASLDDMVSKLRFFSNHLHVEDIAPSAYASSTKAVDHWSSIIDANLLESASEIGELLSLLPTSTMDAFFRFLGAIPKAKWLAGLLQLADFAANTYLLWKFGLEPFASDLQEVSEKIDDVARRARAGTAGVKSLRGMNVHHFSIGDGYWAPFKLTTRSEVICSFPAYSTLMAILPLKLSGLDPSPSQGWDLVPFSFAVDWFFNIGGKIRAGETYFHMLTARVEGCVHSYKIEGKVTDLPFRFVDPRFDCSDLVFTKYWRLVSAYFPPPKTSRFDFLSPGDPPMLIGLSLLWSLLRS